MRELQQLAAYGEQPAKISTGLIELGGGGIPHFAHPQANRYLAARQLVSEQRYTLLHQLDEHERAEVALLIATMLDDPAPLYKALWNGGKPRAEDVLTLGRCLRERAPVEPAWALRVAGALARHGEQGRAGHARSGAAAAARMLAGAGRQPGGDRRRASGVRTVPDCGCSRHCPMSWP